jgi:hypothetical protein
MVGRRNTSEPSVRDAFYVAPKAACNCFSTAVIFSVSSYASFVASAAGWVEQSFSYSTVVSTSSNLFTPSAILFSSVSILFSMYLIFAGVGVGVVTSFERVVR